MVQDHAINHQEEEQLHLAVEEMLVEEVDLQGVEIQE
jgi:hypothetical protein